MVLRRCPCSPCSSLRMQRLCSLRRRQVYIHNPCTSRYARYIKPVEKFLLLFRELFFVYIMFAIKRIDHAVFFFIEEIRQVRIRISQGERKPFPSAQFESLCKNVICHFRYLHPIAFLCIIQRSAVLSITFCTFFSTIARKRKYSIRTSISGKAGSNCGRIAGADRGHVRG